MEAIGSYRVVRRLGRGGMAVVYEVERAGTTERFALKLLHDDRPEVVARFRREGELLERLRGVAGIVRLVEAGAVRGQPFLVLELVGGGDLEEALRKGLALERALDVLGKLARTLDAAHAAQVVHRDLKPGNVLLTLRGAETALRGAETGDLEPRLADLGLARDLQRVGLTRTGEVLGTYAYMAPEQLDGSRPVSPSADVYALGAILYRILAGESPFEGTGAAVAKRILLDAPRPPSSVRPGVSPELERLCLETLAKDPESRPLSAREFAERLEVARKARTARSKRPWLALAGAGVGGAIVVAAGLHVLPSEPAPSATVAPVSPSPSPSLVDEVARIGRQADDRAIVSSASAAAFLLERARALESRGLLDASELGRRAFVTDPPTVLASSSSGHLAKMLNAAALARLEGQALAGPALRLARRELLVARLLDAQLDLGVAIERLWQIAPIDKGIVARRTRIQDVDLHRLSESEREERFDACAQFALESPHDMKCLELLGEADDLLGRPAEAKALLLEALKTTVDGDDLTTRVLRLRSYKFLGEASRQLGDLDGAIAAWMHLRDTVDGEARLWLARAQLARGRDEDVHDAAKNLAELDASWQNQNSELPKLITREELTKLVGDAKDAKNAANRRQGGASEFFVPGK